jgi:hypothetical protein
MPDMRSCCKSFFHAQHVEEATHPYMLHIVAVLQIIFWPLHVAVMALKFYNVLGLEEIFATLPKRVR